MSGGDANEQKQTYEAPQLQVVLPQLAWETGVCTVCETKRHQFGMQDDGLEEVRTVNIMNLVMLMKVLGRFKKACWECEYRMAPFIYGLGGICPYLSSCPHRYRLLFVAPELDPENDNRIRIWLRGLPPRNGANC